jgi:hypothetical protein
MFILIIEQVMNRPVASVQEDNSRERTEGEDGEMRSDRIPEKELKKYHLKGDRSFGRSPYRWKLSVCYMGHRSQ